MDVKRILMYATARMNANISFFTDVTHIEYINFTIAADVAYVKGTIGVKVA